MKIVINERGSEAFYKEVVNISGQYRFLLQNKNYKLKDYFKQFKVLLIAGCTVLVLLLIMCFAWGFKTFDYVAIIGLGLTMIMCCAYLYSLNRYKNAMMTEAGESTLNLDEEGVELNKKDAQVYRNSWNNIECVIIAKEALTFMPKMKTGMMICIERKYEEEILNWLKENQAATEIRNI